MADLSSIEKLKIEKLFDMGTGYVIDFSNRTFSEFILENTGIEINDSKYDYASGSKANRLRAFWQKEANHVVGQLLLKLLEYWTAKKENEISSAEQSLHDECTKIAKRLLQDSPVENPTAIQAKPMTNDKELDVYISCSKKDQEIVERIGSQLNTVQAKYWYTLRTSLLPINQLRAVDEAIEKCRVVIVLLSSNYIQDTFCHSDIRKAGDKDKNIIVFSMEDIDYPETLNSIYSRKPKDKKPITIVPLNAWERPLDENLETLSEIVLTFLGRTEKQIQFNATLDLNYYTNRSNRTVASERNLQVFLCHSSSDKPMVEKFYDRFVNDGVDAWLDKKNLIPGQNWQLEIPRAVRNSDIVVVFLSSSSITKEGFVQKEIKIALDTADEKPEGTIFIIPARLENCEVPERLAKFQWVDLFEKDGYERLFKALQIRANSLNIVIDNKINASTK